MVGIGWLVRFASMNSKALMGSSASPRQTRPQLGSNPAICDTMTTL